MALILCLETSSKNCSVAISKNGESVFLTEKFDDNYCHGEQLHVLIQELLVMSSISIKDFDAFAFSAGPGSYTGLRIGAASAKGFSFAMDKPIISISTLKSMAFGLLRNNPKYDFFCPTINSRKGEIYLAMYTSDYKEKLAPFSCEIEHFPFNKYLKNKSICFFGTGNEKLKSIITHENAYFLNTDCPSSSNLCYLAEQKFINNDFANLAYCEPLYLKNFIPTISKKSIYK